MAHLFEAELPVPQAEVAMRAVHHELLQNRVLQWSFLNARMDSAFSAQEHVASAEIHRVWDCTAQIRRECHALAREVRAMEIAAELNAVTETAVCIHTINRLFIFNPHPDTRRCVQQPLLMLQL